MHLAQFITESIESGIEVILTVDSNEHVVKGKLSCQIHNVGIVEAYSNNFKSAGLASCFRSTHHVDSVWCTRNVVPASVSK